MDRANQDETSPERMISTGIDALDNRLGGLLAGRYYIVSGAPGAGKTSVALHFLGAGLDAGETCAILTQEDPGDLISQGDFLGYDLKSAAEREQLIVLQYRLDFAHNYTRLASPEKLLEELHTLTGERKPERFVIDSIAPFIDTSGAAHDTVGALVRVLEGVSATTYITVPGDLSETRYWTNFDRIMTGAAGIFHVSVESGKIREFTIRKVRQVVASTDPFRFTIRPGSGIAPVRDEARALEELTPELRRRVVVLGMSARLSEEFQAGLEHAYDVHYYQGVESAFAELAAGEFSVLILVFDSRQPAAVIELTKELRRAGNGVPILFVTSNNDLRSSTRANGLRAGGDDFLTDDLYLQEFLERVEVARSRGFRAQTDIDTAESLLVQPTGDDGSPVLLDDAEVRRAVRHHLGRSNHPFFTLLFLRPPDFAPDIWKVLCEDLRVGEGDLVGAYPDGRLVVYLHDVSRRDVRELLGRIVVRHPEFAMVEDVVVLSFPTDRVDVETWLTREETLQEAEVS